MAFQPDNGGFDLELPPGSYKAEWFSLAERVWTDADGVSVASAGAMRFEPPSASGPCVLHLARDDS